MKRFVSLMIVIALSLGHLAARDAATATVAGTVKCAGLPVEGVRVSDGLAVVLTDANGRYRLDTDKRYGAVFVTAPAGYAVADTLRPRKVFHRAFAEPAGKGETIDFTLERDGSPSDPYVVIALADVHLAAKCNDYQQYTNIFLPDINRLIDSYHRQGRKVYVITLGDQSWDRYWYPNSSTPREVDPYLMGIRADRLYNCMGNHDHDIKLSGDDHAAAHVFRSVWGPTHYSFDLGGIHFVVLDNMLYESPGNSPGKFHVGIAPGELEWLRADLATVPDKSTPLVVAFHASLFKRLKVDASGRHVPVGYRPDFDGRKELVAALEPYADVTVLSGHAHVNEHKALRNIREYNVANLGATWWYTGRRDTYLGDGVASDGSPGGYLVMEVDAGGKTDVWYKAIGHRRDWQFRAYDLNQCRLTPKNSCAGAPHASDLKQFLKDFPLTEVENGVLVNVWAYAPGWKVEAVENGVPLPVTQVMAHDPLRIHKGAVALLNSGARIYDKKGRITEPSTNPHITGHMFLVQASTATSPVDITVTDLAGHTYRQRMHRPCPLSGMRP